MKTPQQRKVLNASVSTEWVSRRLELHQIFDLLSEQGYSVPGYVAALERALLHAKRATAAVQLIDGQSLDTAAKTLGLVP